LNEILVRAGQEINQSVEDSGTILVKVGAGQESRPSWLSASNGAVSTGMSRIPAAAGHRAPKPPRVSVIMAAYNAAPYLRQAILSILGQSFADFELIIVDDASTDATAAIAASIADPRLRLLASPANLGAAEARNLGFAAARGAYLAIQDADDISHPTRLARQVEHLDRHPGDVLVASDIRQMHPGGEMIQPRTGGPASPLLLEWMLHLGNPIGFSSVMMRVSALRRLPQFLRETRRYAEDYDLYARLLAHGGLYRLPQPLLIYRVHPGSCSALNHARMVEQTGRVLGDIWARDLIGDDNRAPTADLIARHIAAAITAESPQVLRAVRDALLALSEGFLARHPECTPAEQEAVMRHASRLWEGLVRASLRAGTVTWPSVPYFRAGNRARLRSRDLVGAALQGMVPRRIIDLLRPRPAHPPEPQQTLAGCTGTEGAGVGGAGVGGSGRGPVAPPVLFVAVVLHGAPEGIGTEELRPSAAFALRAQAIFDRYGLRPAYLLDGVLADQAPACLALRNVHDGGGCGIGAWWDEGTSRAGVETLLAAVETGCGVAAAFTTSEAAQAIPVLPGVADPAGHLAAIPLTRAMIVPLASALSGVGGSAMSQSDGPWAALPDHCDLAHSVALLPDEIASEPQIMLIRTMLPRAHRRFFVRLHLRQGDPRSAAALDRLARVCAWFFEDLGGLPGDIRTLAADRRRRPRAVAVAAQQSVA
jgi:glycosyltransferase involved in cell wall biosynthesis